MKINQIKTNPKNPRLIKDLRFKKLIKSILTFPEMLELRPIIIDENNMILGGNMRYKALKEILLLNIPIEIKAFELDAKRTVELNSFWLDFQEKKEVKILKSIDLTDSLKNEFIVKDNIGFGENDWDVLANEWDSVELEDWGLELPIFGDFEEPKEQGEKEEKRCPHCNELL